MSSMSRATGPLLSALAFSLLPLAASAQGPQLINYQGRLVNGTNLVNGSVGLSLRLFDASSGGTKLYEDSNTVTVADGLYSTLIGDGTNFGNLPTALETTNVWIEVAVNGAALSPRERLVSVAYALGARSAQGVAANAITASMLATGAVQAIHLAPGAVTAAALADGAVSSAKIASNTIASVNVADGGLVPADFRSDVRTALHAFIHDPSPAPLGAFSYAIAWVSSNRVVVGAPAESLGAGNDGCVYLFDRDGTRLATITNPAPAVNDRFGTAVAGVGSGQFAIGTPRDDTGASDAGLVYLFDVAGNLSAVVSNPAPATGDQFGLSLSAVGPAHVLVGAALDDAGATDAGSAYLYDLAGNLRLSVTNPTPAAGDHFGESVAAVGNDRFVVSAPGDDTGGANAGSVYLYSTNGTLLAVVTNPVPAGGNGFGNSVSGAGADRFVVGVAHDDTGGSDVGRAYLYDRNGILLASVTNPVPAPDANFGSSVAGFGSDRFVVGALGDNAGASHAGAAYVYDLNGNLLETLLNPDPGADDLFGAAAAGLRSGQLAIGVPFDVYGGVAAGRLVVYSTVACASGLVSESVAPGSVGRGELEQQLATNIAFLNAGTYPDDRLSANIARLDSGSYPDARLSTNIARLNVQQTFSAPQAVSTPPGFRSLQALGDRTGTFNSAVVHLENTNRASAAPTLRVVGWGSNVSDDGVLAVSANGAGRIARFGNSNAWVAVVNNSGDITALSFTPTSDRNAKENFAAVDPAEILEKVAALPLARWNYKADAGTVHIGPMAQDFHAAFDVGPDDKHIATVDADGVALAAIQALAKENAELKKQNEDVLRRLQELESSLQAVLQAR